MFQSLELTCPSEPLVCSLLARADAQPHHPALLTETGPLSYGALAGMVRAAAARVRRRGWQSGERVLLCGPNSPELAAAYFAVHAAGHVAVPMDPDIPPAAAQWIAEDSGARLALVARNLSLPIPTEDLGAVCRPARGTEGDPACGMHDVADLLYTSGTTGRKKGVVLTHRNIAQAALNINIFIRPCPADIEVVPIPLSHSFGLGRLRCMAQVGHALALEGGMRNPARVLNRILELKATGLALVPAGFDLILGMTKDRLAEAQRHLRYVEIGSAAMRPEARQKLMELLPRTRICHHYGLTEASRSAFIDYHADRHKAGSIGRAAPNVTIAIHDAGGRPASPGQRGELVVRGGMVMHEYWKQPELTAQVLRDGWLHTGDWGYQDDEGYFYLAGRESDVVNVGGLKVSPEEIEQVLNLHPSVAESACVGVPDPSGITGESVKACVVMRTNVADEELVAWLRQRLEEFKIPRVWQRVDRIAKTPSGKIQRHLMRDGPGAR